MKIVRNLKVQLKQGKGPEFTRIFNAEVLPLLEKQPGFTHELAMVNGDHAMGISVWKDKASAEKYNQAVYPTVMQKLSGVIEGTPLVENYELAGASF